MNQAINYALKTWYPKGHKLHLCPHHPLGKLLGEWGELLDDYMKSQYKPGYKFEPKDELGDIWYYVRILCYQKEYTPVELSFFENTSTDYIIATVLYEASRALITWIVEGYYSSFTLDCAYTAIKEIGNSYDLSLDDLTRSNWQKLKPGSERGEEWVKAWNG